MRDFRSLEIWKRGHALTLDIYQVSGKCFPKDELCFEDLSSKVVATRKMILTFIAHTSHLKVPKARPRT